MCLDTGADVALLNTADWTAMGRPKLQPPRLTLKSANNEAINVRGCYECNFIIDALQNTHPGQTNAKDENACKKLCLLAHDGDLTNGTRGVKMESQFNRRNGARRRSFEDCFAKDYRGQKLVLSGSSHAVIGTTATNTFLDVFDLPLLDSVSKDDGATPTADSSQRQRSRC
ncbi:hypothetical protein RB195_010193 [Necator americanus]|uniref:Peptidase A2 domain-containing protein n=1 Tax=Necator americanus TaxID=51031 RepID=A0ABR1CWU5_NECAM